MASRTVQGLRLMAQGHTLHDHTAALEVAWMGSVCEAADYKEHADHRLWRREDLAPGKPDARAALHEEAVDLVLSGQPPLGARCRDRRQYRAVHQPRVPS